MDDGERLAPWQEPFRGGYPEPGWAGLSGIEAMRIGMSGKGIRPPISRLTGMLPTAADETGHAVFEMPASGWFLSSQEHISGGALTMLADGSLGVAVFVGLPPATPYTTSELSMSFIRPCPAGGTIRSIGRMIHAGRPLAISGVWVEDGRGNRVAHGTSTCMVMPTIEGIGHPGEIPEVEEPEYDTLDPYLRPPIGEIIEWETWRTMSGREILEGQIAGDLPQPPIHYLTGLTLREASDESVAFTLPASPWLSSPLRTVQGGAIAMLAQSALTTAVIATLEPGSAYRPVDVKVNFLRPVFPDGKELVARGVVTHRGRTLAVGGADVFGTDGRKVAMATGSVMILPERPDPEP